MYFLASSTLRRSILAAGGTVAMAASLALAGPAQAAVGASINNDTLTIRGNAASDKITLRLAPGDPTTLQLDVGDDGIADQSFNRSLFSKVVVRAGGGADRIRIDQSNGTFTDETLTLDGGSGNDDIAGGDGKDLMIGGSGNDHLDGNRGDDVAFLGSGNDTFTWDPGDGSDVVEGQSGWDTLDFNGANVNENMSLTANGSRAIFFRDVANITMDTRGVERLDLTALGGADKMTVNDMTGTDMTRADVDLSATGGAGDGQADQVIVNGSPRSDHIRVSAASGRVLVSGLKTQVRIAGSEKANDQLTVNGRAGNDEVTVREGADALIGLQLNL